MFFLVITIIQGNFGRISIIISNQLNNSNLLVVYLVIHVGKGKNQLPGHKLCMFMVANCVYLYLKVSNVTPKRWGFLGQSYILRFKTETIDIILLQLPSLFIMATDWHCMLIKEFKKTLNNKQWLDFSWFSGIFLFHIFYFFVCYFLFFSCKYFYISIQYFFLIFTEQLSLAQFLNLNNLKELFFCIFSTLQQQYYKTTQQHLKGVYLPAKSSKSIG